MSRLRENADKTLTNLVVDERKTFNTSRNVTKDAAKASNLLVGIRQDMRRDEIGKYINAVPETQNEKRLPFGSLFSNLAEA